MTNKVTCKLCHQTIFGRDIGAHMWSHIDELIDWADPKDDWEESSHDCAGAICIHPDHETIKEKSNNGV